MIAPVPVHCFSITFIANRTRVLPLEAKLETSKIANILNTLQREHIINRANSSFQKGDNAILQKGVKKSQSFQSANSHVYVILNEWTKMLNFKKVTIVARYLSLCIWDLPAALLYIWHLKNPNQYLILKLKALS